MCERRSVRQRPGVAQRARQRFLHRIFGEAGIGELKACKFQHALAQFRHVNSIGEKRGRSTVSTIRFLLTRIHHGDPPDVVRTVKISRATQHAPFRRGSPGDLTAWNKKISCQDHHHSIGGDHEQRDIAPKRQIPIGLIALPMEGQIAGEEGEKHRHMHRHRQSGE